MSVMQCTNIVSFPAWMMKQTNKTANYNFEIRLIPHSRVTIIHFLALLNCITALLHIQNTDTVYLRIDEAHVMFLSCCLLLPLISPVHGRTTATWSTAVGTCRYCSLWSREVCLGVTSSSKSQWSPWHIV